MRPLSEILSDRRVKVADFGDDGAAFVFKHDRALRVIVSIGGGWDHVSVSAPSRTPSWKEMDAVKRLCFRPDEAAMQVHPQEQDHISVHHRCLHLWRPQDTPIPLPPKVMV